jgi:hypothetical protein
MARDPPPANHLSMQTLRASAVALPFLGLAVLVGLLSSILR